jgi:hypothetical protein
VVHGTVIYFWHRNYIISKEIDLACWANNYFSFNIFDKPIKYTSYLNQHFYWKITFHKYEYAVENWKPSEFKMVRTQTSASAKKRLKKQEMQGTGVIKGIG